jgi:hypothetical protein
VKKIKGGKARRPKRKKKRVLPKGDKEEQMDDISAVQCYIYWNITL